MIDAPVLATRRQAGYGWRPDLPDQRDILFAARPERIGQLPSEVDLEPVCPEVYAQGQLGSCTANAIAAAMQYERRRHGLPNVMLSRLFIYWHERRIEGTVRVDAGAMLRDGMKVVAHLGAPPESDWPYIEDEFATPPPSHLSDEAAQNTVLRYMRVSRQMQQMKGCLADGFPFVFGFTVYETFESEMVGRTGMLDLPLAGEKMLGGHAVLAVGYSDQLQRWKVRNSWGRGWGLRGYFWMPYPYLLTNGLSNDFWTIRQLQRPS